LFCIAANFRFPRSHLACRLALHLSRERPRFSRTFRPQASHRSTAMDAPTPNAALHRPGRGRVFDSIVDAIGDTPTVRLNKLPKMYGVGATILAKLDYFNPAASVKDRIGAAMIV